MMKPKILLLEHPRIPSPGHYNDVANTPLSSCLISGYIAAVLADQGFSVELCESYLSGKTFSQCFKDLEDLDLISWGSMAFISGNIPRRFLSSWTGLRR